MDTVSMSEARASLPDFAAKAKLTGEPTMLTRSGKPIAVLVPVEWYERATAALAAKESK
jgi:prevent-host-death family protein